MTLDDFYKKKIAALLHDPPSKCWFIDGTRGRRGHESEAIKIANGLFVSKEIVELIDSSEVTKADHLASSLDRWLLEVAMGGKYEPDAYKVRSSKLLNQFTKSQTGFASIETNIPSRFDEHLNNFIHSLNDLLSEDKYRNKWREIYHILYASLEYCWTKEVGVIGPDDTRVPTHSIFDHLYATATALNMLDEEGRVSGYLVTIDLAGIQTFISTSRKMLDLWAGSWLVSALAWSVVEEFVKILGPDILVLPTARGNPFYYHTFRGLTKESGRKREYEDIGKYFYGYDGYPRNPVVPGTVSFMLPKREDILSELSKESGLDFGDKCKVRASIEQIFRQKWRALSISLADDELREACNQLGVFDVPPLTLRVVVEEVAVKEIPDSPLSEESFHDSSTCRSENHTRSAEYLAYHRAFHKSARDRRNQAKFKASPFVNLELTEYTKQKYFVCHVCGLLPSSKTDQGEKLCVYCVIRRKLNKSEGLNLALDALFDYRGVHEIQDFAIPSVSDVAARSFVRKLCETRVAKEAAEKHSDWIPWVASCEELGKGWRYLIGLDSEKQLYGREGNDKGEPHENQRRALDLLNDLNKDAHFSEKLNPYFAILRVDADNMGKLVLGLLGKSSEKDSRNHGGVSSLDFKLFNHLSRSTENPKLKAVIEAIGKEDFDKAADIAFQEFNTGRTKENLANDFKCLYLRLREGCSFASGSEPNRSWTSNLVLSPSYHSTISRMLMKLAIEATRIVEENDGELIYAGGDDVLAILPASRALEASRQLRDRFRGESSQVGFLGLLKGTQAYIPSMGDLGVSLSLLFAHYLYPLSVSLQQSGENEEEFAKKARWVTRGNVVEKDSFVIEYSPRGGQSMVGVIPLNDNRTLDLLSMILDEMQSKNNQAGKSADLSASFLRDLLELYDKISQAYNPSKGIAKSILQRVFVRNYAGPKEYRKEIIDRLTDDILGTFAIEHVIVPSEPKRLCLEVINSTLAIRGAIE